MSWSMLIPFGITLFAFGDAYETSSYYINRKREYYLISTVVSAIAWLIWWVV